VVFERVTRGFLFSRIMARPYFSDLPLDGKCSWHKNAETENRSTSLIRSTEVALCNVRV